MLEREWCALKKCGLVFALVVLAFRGEANGIRPPSSLKVVNPANGVVGGLETPTVRVVGVALGDRAILYTDSACQNQVGEAVARHHLVHITTSPLSPGDYLFYAKIVRKGKESPCSRASARYQFVSNLHRPSLPPLSSPVASPVAPPSDAMADYSPEDRSLAAFEKNRRWAERVAANPWGQLVINVVTMLTPMSFLAPHTDARMEAARALVANERGLVDIIPPGEARAVVLREGEFALAPVSHQWQWKTFPPLEKGLRAHVLEVGKYSAKIHFPLIPEADWYSLQITNLKTMLDENFFILIYPPTSEESTSIEYLIVGLRSGWEYNIQISAMARGIFFLDRVRARATVSFKTGGNPVSALHFP